MATHLHRFDAADGYKARGANRSDISIVAELQGPIGERVAATIRNLSTEGFMAETDGRFPIGNYIWLHLPEGPLMRARVAWALNRKLGAKFAEPISPETWVDPDDLAPPLA